MPAPRAGRGEPARTAPVVDGAPARAHVLAACTAAGFSPAIAHEACDASLVATLVHLGLGVALYPRLSQLPPGLDLRRVPTGDNAPARTFLTCTRRGGRRTPNVAAALAALEDRTATTTTAEGPAGQCSTRENPAARQRVGEGRQPGDGQAQTTRP
ncbi:LysR substrate-binding domain-containing protein [Prauserella aidingensis]|uniref:LysR substrate-binding domain-containing protein n=1 Tax=Prauserella aidingensis TaxID=387890 RepID=UPI0027E2483E|nr:LysR substrate-binding domain-containing protein [Prauserella aidingensis]